MPYIRHIYAIYTAYTPQKVEGLMGFAREADQKRKRAERRLWLSFFLAAEKDLEDQNHFGL